LWPCDRDALVVGLETFLIHKDGRLIMRAEAEDATDIDDEVLSSMLTAIRDYIEEAFRPREESYLNEIQYGDYTILMEEGELTYMALIVRPNHPAGLHMEMRRAIAEVEDNIGPVLVKWKGEIDSEIEDIKIVLENLIKGDFSDSTSGLLEPTAERSRLFETISKMIRALANQVPVVLFIDDLQWMDVSSLDLLHYLTRNALDTRVLIIGTYRPEDLVNTETPDQVHDLVKILRRMSREKIYTLIKLERLEKENVGKMVSFIFKNNEFSSDLVSRIFTQSKGNPLFIEEMVQVLLNEEFIFEEGQIWYNKDIGKITIPGTIKDVVLRRVGRLGDKERALLQAAAVVGSEFELEVIMETLGWTETEVVEVLDNLNKLRVLKESLGEERYTFDHEVLKEVLYDSMSRVARRRLHQKVGVALEKIFGDGQESVIYELALHYSHTRDTEKSVEYNLRAGLRALKSYAAADSVKYLEVAIEGLSVLSGKTTEDLRSKKLVTYFNLGRAYHLNGQEDEALEHLEPTLVICLELEDQKLAGEIHLLIGDIYLVKNDFVQAMEHYKAVMNIGSHLKNLGLEGMGLRGIGKIFWRRGEFDMADVNLEKAINIFTELDNKEMLGSLYIDKGNISRTMGDIEKTVEAYEKGRKLLEEAGNPFELARVYNNLGSMYYESVKNHEKGIECYLKCREIAGKCGDLRGQAYSTSGLSGIYLELGDQEKGREFAREAMSLFQKLGEKGMIAEGHVNFGVVAKMKKDYGEAEKEFKLAIKMFKEVDMPYNVAHTYLEMGKMHLENNQAEKAVESLRESLKVAERIGAKEYVDEAGDLLKKLDKNH
jgi:tetratricopeptide (TPR) repeat protein